MEIEWSLNIRRCRRVGQDLAKPKLDLEKIARISSLRATQRASPMSSSSGANGSSAPTRKRRWDAVAPTADTNMDEAKKKEKSASKEKERVNNHVVSETHRAIRHAARQRAIQKGSINARLEKEKDRHGIALAKAQEKLEKGKK